MADGLFGVRDLGLRLSLASRASQFATRRGLAVDGCPLSAVGVRMDRPEPGGA